MLWKIIWGAGWWMDWKGPHRRQGDQLEDGGGGVLEGGETGLAERLNVGLREEE